METLIGLRVDVDTFRGTKQGVPALCELFRKHSIKASFFFSVGPDNMGRHLWRLLKPAFLWKMLRTKAASLYGWDIILMGTMWPGPGIGKHLGQVIKACDAEGHETGFHAWDHQRWQSKIDKFSSDDIYKELKQGIDSLTAITGKAPVSSAAPGWKGNAKTLLEKEKFKFKYSSDTRGDSIFMPQLDGKTLETVQIPVTLPTYDEMLGRDGVTNENYNERMLALLRPGKLNILTIHAEAEGNLCLAMFDEFIQKATAKGFRFTTMGEVLEKTPKPYPVCGITLNENFPGREGWIACQAGL